MKKVSTSIGMRGKISKPAVKNQRVSVNEWKRTDGDFFSLSLSLNIFFSHCEKNEGKKERRKYVKARGR